MRLVVLVFIFFATVFSAFGQGDLEFITATTYNGGAANVGSALLPAPTGVEVGDYMLAQLSRRNNSTPNSVPTGWTLLTSGNNGNSVSQ